MKTLTARLLISTMLLFAVAACASPALPTIAPATLAVTATAITAAPPTAMRTAVLSKAPTEAPTATETPTLLPTVEPTRPPAAFTVDVPIDTPALADSETVTSAITPTLSIRNPTAPELGAYFAAVYPDHALLFDWKDITLTIESPNADSQPVLSPQSLDDFDKNAGDIAITYTDVNGDGQADLVTHGQFGLIVLLWQGNHYSQPLAILGDAYNWMPPITTVSFADWTDDGVPEVVFDSANVNVHGSGIWGISTMRYIVHCQAGICQTVWADELSSDVTDYVFGGLDHYQVDMRPGQTQDGAPAIRAVDQGFSIYCCWTNIFRVSDAAFMYVLTSTLSIYPWDGQAFGPAQVQIIHGATRSDSRSSLMATNAQGAIAAVSANFNNSASNSNDYCQLAVAGQPVGGHFGCRGNFTTVDWKDITGDGVPDIVITAYSNAYASDSNGNKLADETCMHQRLLAYQWDGQHATLIANVAGCVVREDLYGVRLADVDGDGKPEIEAAPNGKLKNRAYKWNGKQFVMWGEVPLPPEP